MPPKPNRKRRGVSPPSGEPPSKRSAPSSRSKGAVFDSVDQLDVILTRKTAKETENFLSSVQDTGEDSSSDDSSDAEEFEDVPLEQARRHDTEDEMEWEDAVAPTSNISSRDESSAAAGGADLELTLSKPDYIVDLTAAGSSKKGPTKVEREIRLNTHRLHVLSLMWHNTIRNSWINDKEVHKILTEDRKSVV